MPCWMNTAFEESAGVKTYARHWKYSSFVQRNSVAIRNVTWSHGEFAFAFEYDLAAEVHGRKHALLEENDVLFLQAKVLVFAKELLSGLHRSATCHNVPNMGRGRGEKKKKARNSHFLEVAAI